MEYFARQCRCGEIVKYSRDGDMLKPVGETGHFKQMVSQQVTTRLKGRSMFGVLRYGLRKMTYARRVDYVIVQDKVKHIYCNKCHARLFLRKFTKMDT